MTLIEAVAAARTVPTDADFVLITRPVWASISLVVWNNGDLEQTTRSSHFENAILDLDDIAATDWMVTDDD